MQKSRPDPIFLDTAYRVTAQSVFGLYQRDYTEYDPNGNLTLLHDVLANTTYSYGYDALNRLIAASGGFDMQSISYDKNGNRLSWQNGLGTTLYGYTANSNRLSLVNAASIGLDANGNISTDGRRSYTYNTYNQLETVDDDTTYRYNALGQRIGKKVVGNSASYVYDTASK